MTQEQMTIHKALAELKTIDARIAKSIREGKYVIANKHSNEKIEGVSISAYKDKMKSDYQKVDDLIRRRNAIKKAVVLSNAKTIVTVNGIEYTVAEAIDMKNHGMDSYKILLDEMRKQYAVQLLKVQTNTGEELERKAEGYILSVIQSQPKESKMTVDSDGMKNLKKQYIEDNAFDLVDPNGIAKKMEELSDVISKFEIEIDSCLSVSNALTVISIEY